MSELFKNIDCIELYVSNLDEGIQYYCDSMGLRLLWRNETMVGLGMGKRYYRNSFTMRKKANFCRYQGGIC